MHAPASITHGLALALFVMPAVAASALAVPAPAPQLVVIDGNQQLVVPRAEPKLPSDAELAQVRVDPELVRLARELGTGSTYEGANHPGMLTLVGRIAKSTMGRRA